VRDLDARPALPRTPLVVGDVADVDVRETSQLERVDSHQPSDEIVLHVAAHALDDGDDGDEEHHADRDAEEREEALELLRTDLCEGEANGLEERHGSGSVKRVRPARLARPSIRTLRLDPDVVSRGATRTAALLPDRVVPRVLRASCRTGFPS